MLGDFTVVTLAKCGVMDTAAELFYSLPKRSVYSWTAMISGYVDSGKDQEALYMYSKMLDDGVEPDIWTFVCIFKACGNLGNLSRGKELHADAKLKGVCSDIFVSSTLISMYGKCGDIAEAEMVFCGMQELDDVAWSGMLSAYVEDCQWEKALCLYRQMYHEGVSLYTLPLLSAVQACCILVEDGGLQISHGPSVKEMAIDIVRALHADARKHGITSDGFVGSTLLNFYGKVGAVTEAEMLCSNVFERDVVAWSAMLSAYAEQCQEEQALRIFRQMQVEGVNPNKLTFVFALQACAALADKEEPIMIHGRSVKLSSFEIGEALHIDAERKGFAFDVLVGSMLVSMYGKCGAVVEAELAFKDVYERDIVSWTALLSAYVKEGLGDKALQLYEQLQKEHISLTDISLVSVLQACRGVGCIEIVRQLQFTSVSSWSEASQLFSNTLIHAYGTCASMVDAVAVFNGMVQPDVVAWSACIAGYSQEGNCAHCVRMFEKMLLVGINPDGVTFLSLLSAFRHAGLVHDAINSFVSITRDHNLMPSLKHFAVMIDLLGRAGNLQAVEALLWKMPKGVDINILLGLLGSCRTHGNLNLAKSAFNHAVQLQPMDATAYVLMSNLYTDIGVSNTS